MTAARSLPPTKTAARRGVTLGFCFWQPFEPIQPFEQKLFLPIINQFMYQCCRLPRMGRTIFPVDARNKLVNAFVRSLLALFRGLHPAFCA